MELSLQERFAYHEFLRDEEALGEFNRVFGEAVEYFDEKDSEDAEKIRGLIGKQKWDIGDNPIQSKGKKELPDLENKSLKDLEEFFRKKAFETLEEVTEKYVTSLNNSGLLESKTSISIENAKKILKSLFAEKVKNAKTFAKSNPEGGSLEIIREFTDLIVNDAKSKKSEKLTSILKKKYEPSSIEKIKDPLTNAMADIVYSLSNAWFFAGTLNQRLDEIMSRGFYYYVASMFNANQKIKTTVNETLTKEETDEILSDMNDIRKKRNLPPISFSGSTIKAVPHTFSLPALKSKTGITTCTSAGECAAYCYAMTGNFQYPDAIAKGEISLMFSLTKEFPDRVIEYLSKLTKTTKGSVKQGTNNFHIVRIHDAGDFYSLKYLAKWLKIAKAFPTIMFYTYTKQLKLSEKMLPPNFFVTYSISGQKDKDLLKLIENGINIKHSRIFGSKKEMDDAGYTDTANDDKGAMKPRVKKVGLVIHNSDKSKEEIFKKINSGKQKKEQEVKKEASFSDYMKQAESKIMLEQKEKIEKEKKACSCNGECMCNKTPKERALYMKKYFLMK